MKDEPSNLMLSFQIVCVIVMLVFQGFQALRIEEKLDRNWIRMTQFEHDTYKNFKILMREKE